MGSDFSWTEGFPGGERREDLAEVDDDVMISRCWKEAGMMTNISPVILSSHQSARKVVCARLAAVTC